MTTLGWITLSGVLMSCIALIGSVTLVLKPTTLKRILLPLVAFSAGSLIGGALFHMLPNAVAVSGNSMQTWLAVACGFSTFFALEQFLHWHHCHRAQSDCKKPLTYLILIGDGLHNLIGGMAVASTFMIDIRLGITTWLAAAAHEVPQELGDFGVLVHGGWSKAKALVFNLLSGLMFLLGGLLTYSLSFNFDIAWLVPFAAGNFLYIGASDLIPEVNQHAQQGLNLTHFLCFMAGLGLLVVARVVIGAH